MKHSPFFKDRSSRQTKHKLHTQMLASKQTNKLVHKSAKSPTTLSSLQQGTPNKLTYSGEKASNREEMQLPPTGYLKQVGLFRRKSPKRKGYKIPSCTQGSDLPYCIEPISSQMSIPCSNCQALGQLVLLWRILKGISSGQVIPPAVRALSENFPTRAS